MENRTYRFMTEKPLYPFGYGLSYTSFVYDNGQYNPNDFSFTFSIKNTGNCDGEEVAQLYLTNTGDKRGPMKTLVGFQRVFIPKGESRKVTFHVDEDFFNTFVDHYQHFEWHPGTFVFHYGDQKLEVRY
jgi:beta-glucosidase